MTANHDQRLVRRLESLKQRFEEIRAHFGLDDRIGFGSLPNAHSVYSLGMLLDVSGTRGSLIYPDYQRSFQEPVMLPEEESWRVIIYPDTSKDTPYIISIYQKKGWWDKEVVEPRVLEVSDLVLEGMIAHELAHWIKEHGKLPERIQEVLGKKEQEFIQFCHQACDPAKQFRQEEYWNFFKQHHTYTNEEDSIDIIASRYGFKEGVIAKLDYMIECLETYDGPEKEIRRVTPKQAIQQMQFRKKQVLIYG